jgi:hypothetical protein
MKTNLVMTICGILAGLGGIPLAVMGAIQAYPALSGHIPGWWSALQFPLILLGVLGTMMLGVVGKGEDTHSTVAQVRASTATKAAEQQTLDAAQPPTAPDAPKGPTS